MSKTTMTLYPAMTILTPEQKAEIEKNKRMQKVLIKFHHGARFPWQTLVRTAASVHKCTTAQAEIYATEILEAGKVKESTPVGLSNFKAFIYE